MLQSRITSKWLFSGRNSKINTFLSLKYRFNNVELKNQRDAMWSRHYYGYFRTSDSSSLHSRPPLKREQRSISGQTRGCCWVPAQRRCGGKLTCWVVAKQYSAVLRMLHMRQSSSKVNLATSEPSFSFSKLVMVSPPLLLVVLEEKQQKKRQNLWGFRVYRHTHWKITTRFQCHKKPLKPQSPMLSASQVSVILQQTHNCYFSWGLSFRKTNRTWYEVFRQRTIHSFTTR